MKRVAADWFDGQSARRIAAEVWLDEDKRLRAQNADGETRAAALADLQISPRVADVPRRIVFADGVWLSISNNDFVDDALAQTGVARASRFLHLLESRRRWIVVCALLAVASGWGVFAWGAPLVARGIAAALPPETLATIGARAYEELRDGWLDDSALAANDKARVEAAFAAVVADLRPTLDPAFDYRLRLHKAGFGNAFALPDGLIVITDELATGNDGDSDDWGLRAVFAHEIAHVEARHGVRLFLRSATAAGLALLLFGDVSGVAAAAAGLWQLKNSRDFEAEADCFAYDYLRANDISWSVFTDFLRRAESGDGGGGEEERAGSDFIRRVGEILSTHPDNEARAHPETLC